MELNDRQQRLINIYKQLYQYRDMLKGSPALTFDVATMTSDSIANSFDAIKTQIVPVIAYLLGLRGTDLPVATMIDQLNRHYKKDDFWRNLWLNYIELCQEEDEEKLAEQQQQIQSQGLSLYEKLRNFQRRRKEIIDSFASKMAPENFPVNAERLFRNYLNMADLDAQKAWDVLIENPAFFSPIIVEDENGKRILSIADAKDINKKIGAFVKKIKA